MIPRVVALFLLLAIAAFFLGFFGAMVIYRGFYFLYNYFY